MADSIIFCGYSKIRYGTKPAGAYIVANVFRSMGLSSVVIDHVFALPNAILFQMIEKFVDSNTKFICLSTTLTGPTGSSTNIMSETDELFLPIMNKIRKIAPNAVFIVGGSKITRHDVSSLPWNYMVKGQAENTLKAIVGHELWGDLLHKEGNIVTDKVYGYDDFNDSSLLEFTEHDGVLSNETLPFEAARGCVFKCAYCDWHMTGKNFGDYNKTEDTLYRLLMTNYEKFGVTRYQFSDDTLNDTEEKVDQLLRVSKRLPFELEFGGYLRIELVDKYKGSASKLVDAGLRGANFGLETLNKIAGSTVGKGYGMNAIPVLKDAAKIWNGRIAVTCNIIIGLPHDTITEIREQQKILVEANFLDHIVYTGLGIPRTGESLFSKGLYQKYYREAKEIHPYFAERMNHPQTALHFNRTHMNWESDIMNSGEAILMAREFTDEFLSKRPFLINSNTCFCAMSMLENFTMSELRSIRAVEAEEELIATSKNKIQKYIRKMLSPDLNIPTTPDLNSLIRLPPTIATFRPFTSKISVNRTLAIIDK